MTITPWEVSGKIDYDKLIKEFGLSPLTKIPEELNESILYRRKIIFAHRDIQKVFDAIKNKKTFAMMTGLMPTGKMHIGHMLIAQQMILWQKLGAKVYIAVADVEAYNARGQTLQDSAKIADDYIRNYIALGLKPANCEIYYQSSRSKNATKSNAYYRLQNLLARHATFNEFKAVYGEITPGKMISALLQAADMLHPQLPEFERSPVPTVIPVGADQDPHIRLARDISQRIKEHPFTQISSTYNVFIPGLGGGKMSSSDPASYIALSDTTEEAEKKIKKYAFSGGKPTLEEHRKKGGNPDIDVSYQYLKAIFEPDDKKLQAIYDEYKSGKMLTSELKQILIDKMTKFLNDIQKKKEKAEIEKYLNH